MLEPQSRWYESSDDSPTAEATAQYTTHTALPTSSGWLPSKLWVRLSNTIAIASNKGCWCAFPTKHWDRNGGRGPNGWRTAESGGSRSRLLPPQRLPNIGRSPVIRHLNHIWREHGKTIIPRTRKVASRFGFFFAMDRLGSPLQVRNSYRYEPWGAIFYFLFLKYHLMLLFPSRNNFKDKRYSALISVLCIFIITILKHYITIFTT